MPLGYYTFCSTIILLSYLKSSRGNIFLLLNFFLGVTGLVKYEGIPIGIIIELCAIYHIYTKKLYRHLPLIIFWLVPLLEWDTYQKVHNSKDTYFSSHVFEISGHKTINAILGTLKELLNIKSWNLLWIIYFYSLFVGKSKINKELIMINLIILSQLCVYMALYLFTVGNNPESSVERLLMHIAPLGFYAVALYVRPIFNRKLNILYHNDKKTSKK